MKCITITEGSKATSGVTLVKYDAKRRLSDQ